MPLSVTIVGEVLPPSTIWGGSPAQSLSVGKPFKHGKKEHNIVKIVIVNDN